MHKKQKGKVGYLLFKIDFEKAYDRVHQDFLRLTLMEFGFPSHTINLIMNRTCSTSLALKWNTKILENFRPNRGLRQGDPLSLYLFLLCMEKLALLIQQKASEGYWKPIKVSDGGPEISHLFFVDDYLLFTKASCSQVRLVKEVLDAFHKAFGLKVNVQKPRFFTSIIHFHHTIDLAKYLGFPLLKGRVRNIVNSPTLLIESMESQWVGRPRLLIKQGE